MPLQSRRPLWQTYLLFLGPMLLSNVLQSLSGTLNNIFIGQFLGLKALAAVSGFFPLLYFFITLSIGLGAGSSILIGRAWGARDHDRVRAVAGTALCLSAVLGLTVAACGLLWATNNKPSISSTVLSRFVRQSATDAAKPPPSTISAAYGMI